MNRLTCVITVAFAVTNILSGCQEKLTNLDYPASNIDTFKSTIESFSPSTKTSIGGNNRIIWSAEDLLAIFQGSAEADKFMITDDSVGTSEGEFSPVDTGNSSNPSNREIKSNVAIYPYMEGLMCKSVNTNLDQSETAVTYEISNINLPSTQNYTPNSFGNGTFPMVAITKDLDDHNLKFKNIFGAIQLKLIGTEVISSIKFEGNNNEILCGQAIATVNSENTSPTITLSDTKATSVTLNCGNGVQLDENSSTSFYIALPPTDFSKGFKVTITDSENNEAVIQTNRRNIIERSSILVMPEIINGETKRTDLNIDGESANCYIISEPGTYFFQARKGNSNDKIVGIESVEVLWETFGNATKPTTGDLISSAFHLDGNIVFTTPFTFTEGNAVIAAKDANGTILWSWHIWFLEERVISHYLTNGQGVMMDRNLGATTTDPEKVEILGLLYQWGRKDPFPSARSFFNGASPAETTAEWPQAVNTSVKTGNIEYSIANPMTFIYSSSLLGDWIYQGAYNPTDPLWDAQKTIYDPCPIGWRVPKLVWNSSNFVQKSNTYKTSNFTTCYPYASYYDFIDGKFSGGGYGFYWTSVTHGYDSNCMILYSGGNIQTDTYYYRAHGASVRCYRDKGNGESTSAIQDLFFDKTSLTLTPGSSYQTKVTYLPENAKETELTWSSDNEAVATVDSYGCIHTIADGTTKICCSTESGISEYIKVTVKSPSSVSLKYIDNNNIDYGYGVELNGVIWAPVNCGYIESSIPTGLAYQWGRKYGQNPNSISSRKGPTTIYGATSEGNYFYKSNSTSGSDWCITPSDFLWNLGNEENPEKAYYDPCPKGWRVPTYQELSVLIDSEIIKGQDGYYYSGEYTNVEGSPRIFLPAGGYIDYSTGKLNTEYSSRGFYWSSKPYFTYAYGINISDKTVNTLSGIRGKGYFVRCVASDGEPTVIPTLSLSLTNSGHIYVYERQQHQIVAQPFPSDATDKITWISENPEIASIDENGLLTGVKAGTTRITAKSGDSSASCTITILKSSGDPIDYIDEYNINHGKGIQIDGAIWAPVNCGYNATQYPKGKLYQWGRKYGQNPTNTSNNPKKVSGPVDLATGQSESNANTVFIYSSVNQISDWLSPSDGTLWNTGSEYEPVKGEYDPCPEGWRVPSYQELKGLLGNYSAWTQNKEGDKGKWFSGSQAYSEDVPQVFLQGWGIRFDTGECPTYSIGVYWSSDSKHTNPYALYFTSIQYYMKNYNRLTSCSVRCVQE